MDKARSYLPTPRKIGVHGGTAMKATTINSPSFLKAPVRPTQLENFARRMVRSRLRKLRNGQVTIKEGDSVVVYGGQTDACQLTAVCWRRSALQPGQLVRHESNLRHHHDRARQRKD